VPFNNPNIAPPPLSDPWVDENGLPDANLVNWFLITLLPAVALSPSVFSTGAPPYSETGLNAAVATTPLPLGIVPGALYRVSVYLRITTPDGVSSSVTPFIQFPDDGVTCTMTGTAMTSDAVGSPSSQVFFANVDSPGPISFGTNYVSNTPNAAVYKAIVIVERVQ